MWDLRCLWRKLGPQWWICKRRVGGRSEDAGALCTGGTGGTGGGGEVLLREVGGQGAAIDLSREKGRIRVEIRKENAQNRPVSVLFVRIGVLVFGQSKHREFCTNTLEMPLAGSEQRVSAHRGGGSSTPIWVPLCDHGVSARNLTQIFFNFHFSPFADLSRTTKLSGNWCTVRSYNHLKIPQKRATRCDLYE